MTFVLHNGYKMAKIKTNFPDLMLNVSKEVVNLFNYMSYTATLLHGQGEMTSGRRAILLDLAENGAQTVPQLARKRHRTRQNIQSYVNQLLNEKLVQVLINPDHKRSTLISISTEGRKKIESMVQMEKDLLSSIPAKIDLAELENTAQILRKLKTFFKELNQSILKKIKKGK
jgi:DNA-binding MarR family transcriptional regulator